MKQSKRLETEKTTFLSLCSEHDRNVLTERANMTLEDYERIAYITMALGYVEYAIYLEEIYIQFAMELSDKVEREMEILEDYPAYYIDEQVYEKQQKWIEDFCCHIPAGKQKFYREKFKNENFIL